jgi:hypothetical protein
MSERFLEEPIELIDADLDVVSGGLQSANGNAHEDGLIGPGENFHAQNNEDIHNHLGN